MRARDKQRLAALRLVNAEIKQVEVDERKALDGEETLGVLSRMLKQRNDSLTAFENAGREDLAAQERFEIALIGEFMPAALSEAEVGAAIDEAIHATGALQMRDMGKVMGALKGSLAGRADMGKVSALVKARLA